MVVTLYLQVLQQLVAGMAVVTMGRHKLLRLMALLVVAQIV
jgi:hypothetical protein